MRREKTEAIRLRKQGKSYSQIGKSLNISKSTLSSWLKDIALSKEAQNRIDKRAHKKSSEALIKRNKQQTALAAERADVIRKKAKAESVKLFENKLFLTGVGLYWAEGYKKGAYGSKWKSVDFANSDPKMIGVIMKFFRESCRIPNEKFKAQVIAHENVDIDKAVEYWSGITEISKDKFIKTSLPVPKKSKNKRKNSNLTHGTLHIRINDVSFFYKMIGWIDGLKEQF